MSAEINKSTLQSATNLHFRQCLRFMNLSILLFLLINFVDVRRCNANESELKFDPQLPRSSDGSQNLASDNLADDAKPSGQQYERKGNVDGDTVEVDKEPVDQINNELKNNPNEDPTIIKKLKDFYSFSVADISGKIQSLEAFRGKVSLIVNVASECGFTDGHYRGLVKLQHKYKDESFTVLAFPCNQFGAQEPGSNSEIDKFVRTQYRVNFPVFAKVNVLEDKVPECWKYLIENSGEAPNWNFWKYLVDRKGHVLGAWGPWVSIDEIHGVVDEAIYNASAGVDSEGQKKTENLPKHGGEL